MPSKERYKRFRQALVAWVEGNVELVALVGHVRETDERIFAVDPGEEVNLTPAIGVRVLNTVPFQSDVDLGIRESIVEIITRHTDSPKVHDMMGAVETLAAQSSSQKSATFTGSALRSREIAWRGVTGPESVGDAAKGELEAVVTLRILWAETA